MITAINNSNQNYAVNFERRKGINTKKIRKAWRELPYKLGIKKKKTIWEKISDFFAPKKKKSFWEKLVDFFTPKKKSPVKDLKKNSKVGFEDQNLPKKDNLFEFMAKDIKKRIKNWDDVFFDMNP